MTMKKYVKPELFYEQFELTTHIANCVWEPVITNIEAALCTFKAEEGSDWAGETVFTEIPRCETVMDEDYFCYYTAADGFNTFDS